MLSQNEFAAYAALTNGTNEYSNMSPRANIIASYSLCGFGNIGSLGTQLGVLSQLAPSRSGDVAGMAVSALITGIFATLSSASIAGMIIQDEDGFQVQAPAKRSLFAREPETFETEALDLAELERRSIEELSAASVKLV